MAKRAFCRGSTRKSMTDSGARSVLPGLLSAVFIADGVFRRASTGVIYRQFASPCLGHGSRPQYWSLDLPRRLRDHAKPIPRGPP